MTRRCELTGKGVQTGNNVSHANNKSRRRFLPNLNVASLNSEVLDRTFRFKVSAAALRTIDQKGGLDSFLLKAKTESLSVSAAKVKKDVERALESSK